jgi:photosystem II stability/assembly factor-like uncharacterized protein
MEDKVVTDNSGNSYVAGIFSSSKITFGNYMLPNFGGSDIFIAKFNSHSKVLWAKNIGGRGDEKLIDLEINGDGLISISGSSYSSEINIDNNQKDRYSFQTGNNKSKIIINIEFNTIGNIASTQIIKDSNRTFSDYKSSDDTSLTLIWPQEEVNWKVGTAEVVRWSSENIESVLIELSTDYGNNWKVIDHTYWFDIKSYDIIVPNTPSDFCLIRISDYSNPHIADTSDLFTISGILHWEIVSNDYNSPLRGIFNINPDICFVAGYNGLSKTTDKGETWIPQLEGYGLFDVFFLNDSVGWATGFYGNFFKTTNGGEVWIPIENEFNFHLLKIVFLDEDNGYMLSDKYLLKTTDKGESWSLLQPTEHILRAMYFINRDTGWVAGGEGVILKTIDGGINWEYQQMNSTEYAVLTSLYFFDESTGWAAGNGLDIRGGVILKTTDGGNNWELNFNDYNEDFIGFFSMSFNSPDSGWVVGLNGRMFNTTNRGNNWELQGSGTLNTLYSIHINSNNDGWCIGGDGIILKYIKNSFVPVELSNFTAILKTSEVLLIWETITETNNLGFDIERKSDKAEWKKIGYVSGQGTTIKPSDYSFTDKKIEEGINYYRLKQLDLDGSFNYSNSIQVSLNNPDKFSLSQNYPNPFNPSTMINYSIPQKNFVTIKIYDILGKEIKTLVNEEKSAGKYEVNFDGSDLSSGAYYYRLQAGAFMDTKKFVLVK